MVMIPQSDESKELAFRSKIVRDIFRDFHKLPNASNYVTLQGAMRSYQEAWYAEEESRKNK